MQYRKRTIRRNEFFFGGGGGGMRYGYILGLLKKKKTVYDLEEEIEDQIFAKSIIIKNLWRRKRVR